MDATHAHTAKTRDLDPYYVNQSISFFEVPTPVPPQWFPHTFYPFPNLNIDQNALHIRPPLSQPAQSQQQFSPDSAVSTPYLDVELENQKAAKRSHFGPKHPHQEDIELLSSFPNLTFDSQIDTLLSDLNGIDATRNSLLTNYALSRSQTSSPMNDIDISGQNGLNAAEPPQQPDEEPYNPYLASKTMTSFYNQEVWFHAHPHILPQTSHLAQEQDEQGGGENTAQSGLSDKTLPTTDRSNNSPQAPSCNNPSSILPSSRHASAPPHPCDNPRTTAQPRSDVQNLVTSSNQLYYGVQPNSFILHPFESTSHLIEEDNYWDLEYTRSTLPSHAAIKEQERKEIIATTKLGHRAVNDLVQSISALLYEQRLGAYINAERDVVDELGPDNEKFVEYMQALRHNQQFHQNSKVSLNNAIDKGRADPTQIHTTMTMSDRIDVTSPNIVESTGDSQLNGEQGESGDKTDEMRDSATISASSQLDIDKAPQATNPIGNNVNPRELITEAHLLAFLADSTRYQRYDINMNPKLPAKAANLGTSFNGVENNNAKGKRGKDASKSESLLPSIDTVTTSHDSTGSTTTSMSTDDNPTSQINLGDSQSTLELPPPQGSTALEQSHADTVIKLRGESLAHLATSSHSPSTPYNPTFYRYGPTILPSGFTHRVYDDNLVEWVLIGGDKQPCISNYHNPMTQIHLLNSDGSVPDNVRAIVDHVKDGWQQATIKNHFASLQQHVPAHLVLTPLAPNQAASNVSKYKNQHTSKIVRKAVEKDFQMEFLGDAPTTITTNRPIAHVPTFTTQYSNANPFGQVTAEVICQTVVDAPFSDHDEDDQYYQDESLYRHDYHTSTRSNDNDLSNPHAHEDLTNDSDSTRTSTKKTPPLRTSRRTATATATANTSRRTAAAITPATSSASAAKSTAKSLAAKAAATRRQQAQAQQQAEVVVIPGSVPEGTTTRATRAQRAAAALAVTATAPPQTKKTAAKAEKVVEKKTKPVPSAKAPPIVATALTTRKTRRSMAIEEAQLIETNTNTTAAESADSKQDKTKQEAQSGDGEYETISTSDQQGKNDHENVDNQMSDGLETTMSSDSNTDETRVESAQRLSETTTNNETMSDDI